MRRFRRLCPSTATTFSPTVAVIPDSGGRHEDRQKMILEGWRDAILSGRYTAFYYHCASAYVAHWISRLAREDRPEV